MSILIKDIFCIKFLRQKRAYVQKRARKMLMKLTPVYKMTHELNLKKW